MGLFVGGAGGEMSRTWGSQMMVNSGYPFTGALHTTLTAHESRGADTKVGVSQLIIYNDRLPSIAQAPGGMRAFSRNETCTCG